MKKRWGNSKRRLKCNHREELRDFKMKNRRKYQLWPKDIRVYYQKKQRPLKNNQIKFENWIKIFLWIKKLSANKTMNINSRKKSLLNSFRSKRLTIERWRNTMRKGRSLVTCSKKSTQRRSTTLTGKSKS